MYARSRLYAFGLILTRTITWHDCTRSRSVRHPSGRRRFASPVHRFRVSLDPIEIDLKPLLDWLLLSHPDTPRNRAKQWILAGRVSVKGEIIRKPHQRLSDPGDTLELRTRRAISVASVSGWQVHPRVALLYLDSALAV